MITQIPNFVNRSEFIEILDRGMLFYMGHVQISLTVRGRRQV